MSDSVTHRQPWRIIQSLLTRGHKRTKCINIPSNHINPKRFIHTNSINSCLIQVVMRLPYGSINIPSLSSSLSAGKIVGCIMLGMLYLYTQLLFLISAYTVLDYFFIRTYHFQGLRMQFQSVSLYAATISKFCVYNFRLFRYTHWSFHCSAYAILSNFPTQ